MDDVWMSYTEGDEVRWEATGEFGTVVSVNEIDQTYVVDIDGVEHTLTEDELS